MKTIELLADDPPPASSSGPFDEWVDHFETYAAKATVEGVRSLFARALAGEIRKPGAFSLASIQTLSVLDSKVADILERVAPHVFDGKLVFQYSVKKIVPYEDLLEIDGLALFETSNLGILAKFDEARSEISAPVYVLTRTGQELVSVLAVEPDINAMAAAIWKLNPIDVWSAEVVYVEGGQGTSGPCRTS